MIISGLQKTTLLDYPGHVAATIFTGGCNFRCPFCHNMNIVTEVQSIDFSEEEILKFLKKRSGILDGVCITGGEPTLNRDLDLFLRKIKSLGLLIKLDTNGSNPETVRKLIDEKLIDYIAMDIKSSQDTYKEVCGINNDEIVSKIKESVNLIMNSGIDYEFRTTVVSEFHDEKKIIEIGKMIKGAKRYFLQAFADSEYVPDHSLSAPDKEILNKYMDILKDYVDSVSLRGVD